MAKAGKLLFTIGLILTIAFAFSIALLFFGVIAFAMLGEIEYFTDYIVLDGYYTGVNLLFAFDYFLMGNGQFGIPLMIVGGILKSKKGNA